MLTHVYATTITPDPIGDSIPTKFNAVRLFAWKSLSVKPSVNVTHVKIALTMPSGSRLDPQKHQYEKRMYHARHCDPDFGSCEKTRGCPSSPCTSQLHGRIPALRHLDFRDLLEPLPSGACTATFSIFAIFGGRGSVGADLPDSAAEWSTTNGSLSVRSRCSRGAVVHYCLSCYAAVFASAPF